MGRIEDQNEPVERVKAEQADWTELILWLAPASSNCIIVTSNTSSNYRKQTTKLTQIKQLFWLIVAVAIVIMRGWPGSGGAGTAFVCLYRSNPTDPGPTIFSLVGNIDGSSDLYNKTIYIRQFQDSRAGGVHKPIISIMLMAILSQFIFPLPWSGRVWRWFCAETTKKCLRPNEQTNFKLASSSFEHKIVERRMGRKIFFSARKTSP